MSYENEIPDTRIKISPVKKMTYLFGEALARGSPSKLKDVITHKIGTKRGL
jgi:hypothetical protein